MAHRVGRTIFFDSPPVVESYASVAGDMERHGPLGQEFDKTFSDSHMGKKTWEQAESELQREAMSIALAKGGLTPSDIDLVFAGDLLNQCTGSTFGLSSYDIPFIGIYSACSTMALGLALAAYAVESGAADRAAAVTSSHFCSSERQFRYPLEYGGQRTPTAQWTATASGAVILSKVNKNPGVKIREACIGKIVDPGVADANNMGAAMAAAAADTIASYLRDTGTAPDQYDRIFTGDLGMVGSGILCDLMDREGFTIRNCHTDCGLLLYSEQTQDVHAGGSGCGCSASVLCSRILNHLHDGNLRNILFCATGALLSPTTSFEGENVPGIAHLVHIS